VIYAGLLGLAAAAVLQFVDKEPSGMAFLVAAYCFAAAMPLLGVGLVTDYARRSGTDVPKWRDMIGLFGALAAVTGLGALLLNFGVGVCLVYASGCALGLLLVRSL
jgi:hypothetical protein